MYKIVLMGRPNVGKSTLFNRLIRSNRAITHDRAGITRDRMEGTVRSKFHRPFILVDTGGITLDSHFQVAEGPDGIRGFEKEILRQAEEAMQEACAICLVVDGREGLMPFDEHIAAYLRKLGKPILLVVNKVDGMEREEFMCADFHVLGFPLVAVSAEHGNQIRYLESLLVDLLPEVADFDEEEIMHGLQEDDDAIAQKKAKKAGKKARRQEEDLAESEHTEEFDFELDFADVNQEDFLVDFDEAELLQANAEAGEENPEQENEAVKEVSAPKKAAKKQGPLKICLLGRPNAGKSSILNAFVGKERMIVSDVAGTTRDSVDVTLVWNDKTYVFVDTAGVRRRSKITDTVERFSVNSSLKSTTKADVILLVIDALQGLTAQDKRLVELLDERKTPFIIVLNKMDLVPAPERKKLQKQFAETLAFCQHVPVMPTSAKNRYGLKMLLPMAEQIKQECSVRVSTGQLNRAMDLVLTKHQPPVVRRVRPKFYYLTQAENEPPTFVFFVNDADRVGESYLRYLEKSLRRLFSIEHAPMRVHLRSSHTKNSEKRNPKKKTDVLEIKEQSQYIEDKPEKMEQPEKTEKVEKKATAGKAKAKPSTRTTVKAALRNPNSPQSRSLKKALRKKKSS